MKINIVGCGLSGITTAVLLKRLGHTVEIFEYRDHIGGNCYDSKSFGTYFHKYGPHIFHTDDDEVFDFLSDFITWKPFSLRPKGNTRLGLISLPYSQRTIKEIGRELSQEEIIEYIFKDYSEKQWGISIDDIPKFIISRIPKTAKHEDPTWFEGQKYQCIPEFGYTYMIENMLDGIKVNLGCKHNEYKKYKCDCVIYTGKIDEYFDYVYGNLPYRSLRFEHTISDRMPYFIENQNNREVEYTRKYDHSYFNSDWDHKKTIITREFPVEHDATNIPYYPMPFGYGQEMFEKYNKLSKKCSKVLFVGRLASYKYLDMWMAIKQSMTLINRNF